jgi:cell division protein FtsN
MPQNERGLYEPGDDMRVYDASEEDEDVEGSRLPLLIVLALLVLAMFAGFVWLAYNEGVARGRGETPVITAAAGPARVAPQNPGGTPEPYKGFKIYEQPAPPDEDVAQDTPAAKPSAVAAPVSQPKAAATPAAPKVAAAAPKPVPTMKPAQLPAQSSRPAGPATAAPRTLAASAPAAKPAASGGTVLQIGAYKSRADADTAWTIYKSKHTALLSGYSPDVQQADLGEKGTWFRLRIAGFPSRDVAIGLCDRLKADGGSCFLSK